MEAFDPFNQLAHDERVIAEKLGIYDYTPKPSADINMNIKLAMYKEELKAKQQRIDELERLRTMSGSPYTSRESGSQSTSRESGSSTGHRESGSNRREHFTGGSCGCASEGMKSGFCHRHQSSDDSLDDLFSNKKLVMLLGFLLIVFAVMQYFTYQSETKELMSMIKSLQASMGTAGQSSNGQPASQPAQK